MEEEASWVCGLEREGTAPAKLLQLCVDEELNIAI